ncbi:MAG: hypothetical protein ABFS56_19530 [Pseudomonadota bacterium]
MLNKYALVLIMISPLAQAAFDCSAVTQIPSAECEVLVTFYNSTGGDSWSDNSGWLETNTPCGWKGSENWTTNTGWKVTNNPCEWYRVSCRSGNLTGLALVSNNLKGTISKKLTKLKKLEILLLNDNQLTGKTPKSMMKLKKLTYLDINDNCLKLKVSKKLGKWLNKLNPGWDDTQTNCLY